MTPEQWEAITNTIAKEQTALAIEAINMNIESLGPEIAAELAVAVSTKHLTMLLGYVYNLKQEQQQHLFNKLADFIVEQIQSIKSAPSEN